MYFSLSWINPKSVSWFIHFLFVFQDSLLSLHSVSNRRWMLMDVRISMNINQLSAATEVYRSLDTKKHERWNLLLCFLCLRLDSEPPTAVCSGVCLVACSLKPLNQLYPSFKARLSSSPSLCGFSGGAVFSFFLSFFCPLNIVAHKWSDEVPHKQTETNFQFKDEERRFVLCFSSEVGVCFSNFGGNLQRGETY